MSNSFQRVSEMDNPVVQGISDFTLAILEERENRERFLEKSFENRLKMQNALEKIESISDEDWSNWSDAPKEQILSILKT